MMGSHQSAAMKNDEWLTPPELLESLGQFDLDPCAPAVRPWPTALQHFTKEDDGLSLPWKGRVWCNPPYGRKTGKWLQACHEHGNCMALIFARTETSDWFTHVWPKADGILFLKERLHFHRIDGTKAEANSGAPSALIAYGKNNAEMLEKLPVPGFFVSLE